MDNPAGLIGLACVVFASTNVDDVLVLLGFFVDPKFRARHILLGQLLGIAALFGVSVLASLISLVFPPAYVGLLGLVPIVIGLVKLWELRAHTDATEAELEGHQAASRRFGNVMAVAAVTIANGGDNIGVYTPFFAERSGAEIALIGVVFAAMTLLWVAAAHWLTRHRTLGAPIRRYGHGLAPFVLILLGILIMYEGGSFDLLRR